MIQGGGGNRGEDSQRLDRGAAAISEDASCVGQWHVDRLCAESGPSVTPAEARIALERQGVRVAELPRLPTQPPSAIAQYPDFAPLVASLGRKLSIELIFDTTMPHGFRLLTGLRLDDGRRLDREAIEEAQRQTPEDADHYDQHRVLSMLADAAQQPQALDDIVFWEVVEYLRSLARLEYPQRAIAEQAVRLSLERSEAEVVAAAVAEEHKIRESPAPAPISDTKPSFPATDHPTSPDLRDQPRPPVSRPVRPQPPQPVTDLQVRPMRGRTDVVQLSWNPPPAGTVWLRMALTPPPWQVGSIIAASEADSYGRPLSADGVPGPDRRMSREVTVPEAQAFVTALTVRDSDATVGGYVEITRGAPVRGLSALRFGEEIRLTWTWPAGAISARVAWQPSAAPEDQPGSSAGRQQRSCTRRRYQDEGGFSAMMGYQAQRIAVWAVIGGPGEEYVTAPAEIEVPAIGKPVRYDLLPVRGLVGRARRVRQRELCLSAEQRCVLPDLIVVECRHPTVPLSPHDKETVTKIRGRAMDPGTPLRIPIPLAEHGPSWVKCFVDPAGPAAARGRVTLIDPPVKRLWVR
jgi:hypothetical protein